MLRTISRTLKTNVWGIYSEPNCDSRLIAQRKLREAGEGRLGLLAERPHLLTLLLTKRVRVSGTPGVRQRYERRAPTEDIDPPSHDNLWGSCRFPLMYVRVDISTRRLCVQLRKSQRVPAECCSAIVLKEKRNPAFLLRGFSYYGDTSSWGRGRIGSSPSRCSVQIKKHAYPKLVPKARSICRPRLQWL